MPFFAIMTMSREGGRLDLFNLKYSLNRRLMRFLLTAFPTFLVTVIPSLLIPDGLSRVMIVKFSVCSRFPCSYIFK